jgi:hypothetical protein
MAVVSFLMNGLLGRFPFHQIDATAFIKCAKETLRQPAEPADACS